MRTQPEYMMDMRDVSMALPQRAKHRKSQR